ncbi:hypothetical protein SK854_05980 [Lentzea sp. BCCO 10_0061]|uniref:Restriction endonuclease type IV Mrr domain-containing protein n=1 Tax=Lentzea sokolovensis TaxID=3095429 RepID=A0ABU4UQD3_9PSEU|nr:hypothetical protein [Lentzea sp. BCCO 10_0061]MDX8141651.1 hypothetical protein [Lentzea sp. BCCO 10_0061]
MTLDPGVVRGHLDSAASAMDTDAQGKAYEKLIVYLFESTPGCLVEPNIISPFGSEQVDVAVGNLRFTDGPALLPATFLVECKDWSRPVDSGTLGYFINTLANRSVEVGLMVAAQGITGDPHDLSYAHSLLIQASARRIRVLVITTDEVAALTSTADFVELLNRRHLRAVASGVGVPV